MTAAQKEVNQSVNEFLGKADTINKKMLESLKKFIHTSKVDTIAKHSRMENTSMVTRIIYFLIGCSVQLLEKKFGFTKEIKTAINGSESNLKTFSTHLRRIDVFFIAGQKCVMFP